MHITSLYVKNYRNHQEFNINSFDKYNIFIGENGIGKTNILEAIDLVISGSSFRNSLNKHLLFNVDSPAFIEAMISNKIRFVTNTVEINKKSKIFKSNNKKRKKEELFKILPVVVFIPDDIKLLTHSSSNKRKYLDNLGSKLFKNYSQIRSDYEKIIQYKNKLLINHGSRIEIESCNDILITCGAKLINYRKTLFDRLLPLLIQEYSSFTKNSVEELSALYITSWDKVNKSFYNTEDLIDFKLMKNKLKQELNNNLSKEREKIRSLIGPHNDQIEFYINNKNVADFASQGQKRSLLLGIKVVELNYIYKVTEKKPILLLDDVFSELDKKRQDILLKIINESKQVFITATDLINLPKTYINNTKVIEII